MRSDLPLLVGRHQRSEEPADTQHGRHDPDLTCRHAVRLGQQDDDDVIGATKRLRPTAHRGPARRLSSPRSRRPNSSAVQYRTIYAMVERASFRPRSRCRPTDQAPASSPNRIRTASRSARVKRTPSSVVVAGSSLEPAQRTTVRGETPGYRPPGTSPSPRARGARSRTLGPP